MIPFWYTLFAIVGHVCGVCGQQSGVVVPNQNEVMDSPSRQVVVQHPVTINVAEPTPLTTPPPVAPLKTRVVVVHNNMVPVPIECFQPPDSGTCSKDLARIYYDHETRTCKPFSYTGCGGNANRFQSIKNCYRICHPYRYKIRPKVSKRAQQSGNARTIKVSAIPSMPIINNSGQSQSSSPMNAPQMRSMRQNRPLMMARNRPYLPSQMPPGGYPPYPPPPGQPYPPYGGQSPFGFGQQYGYLGPEVQQSMNDFQPIIEKRLMGGQSVNQQMIGQTDGNTAIDNNSGKILYNNNNNNNNN